MPLSSSGSLSYSEVAKRLLGDEVRTEQFEHILSELNYVRYPYSVFSTDNSLLLVYTYNPTDYLIFEISFENFVTFITSNQDIELSTIQVVYDDAQIDIFPSGDPEYNVHESDLDHLQGVLKIGYPPSDLVQKITDQRQYILGVTILTTAFGAILIYTFSYISYKPIDSIRRKVQKISNTNIVEKNELNVINLSIEKMNSSITNLKIFKEDNAQTLKQHIIYELVTGKCSIDDINQDRKLQSLFYELEINFEHNFYTAVIIELDKVHRDDWDTYHKFWKNVNKPFFRFYSTSNGLDKIILLACSRTDDIQVLKELLIEQSNLFEDKLGLKTLTYIGNLYYDINQISLSFNQANMAYKFQFQDESQPNVVCYSENNILDDRYKSMFQFFKKSIINKNYSDLKTAIEFPTKVFSNHDLTLSETIFLCNIRIFSVQFSHIL